MARRIPVVRLHGVGGAVALATLGCSLNLGPSQAYFQAMDYTLDRTRVIGIASSPLTFAAGTDVDLEALVLSPAGEVTTATWKTCGLSASVPVNIYDLQCFTDDVDVSLIGEGIPTVWHVPVADWTCDTGCEGGRSSVPVLLEAGVDPDVGRGTFVAELQSGTVEDTGVRKDAGASLRERTLTLTVPDVVDGIVTVEASIDVSAEAGSWSWYVDDGVLLDTGRTITHGVEGGVSTTTNRWQLPEDAGRYRVVVAVSASELGSDDLADSPTNMTWAVSTVEVK